MEFRGKNPGATGILATAAAVVLAGCQALPTGLQRPGAFRVPYLEAVESSEGDWGAGTAISGGAIRVVFDLGGSRTVQAASDGPYKVSDVTHINLKIKPKKSDGTYGDPVFEEKIAWAKKSDGSSDSKKTFVIKDLALDTYKVRADAFKNSDNITKDDCDSCDKVVKIESEGQEVQADPTIKLKGGKYEYGKIKSTVAIEDGDKGTKKTPVRE